jgi:RNA polymerase primary sigma factor
MMSQAVDKNSKKTKPVKKPETSFGDSGPHFSDPEEEQIDCGDGITISTAFISQEEVEDNQDNSDDPVRVYLKEMGGVELLSREGEVEIAKKIEFGKELMLSSLCKSKSTMSLLKEWQDELIEEKISLRDLIDFDANIEDAETSGVEAGDEAVLEEGQDLSAIEEQVLHATLEKLESISIICDKLSQASLNRYLQYKASGKLKSSDKQYEQDTQKLTEQLKHLHLNQKRIHQ